MSFIDMKTIALLQAVRQITKDGSIQLPGVDGRSFLDHTHVPSDELTQAGMLAKCYLQSFVGDSLGVEFKQFTWVSIVSICKSESLDESAKVDAVRKVLDSAGSTLRTVIESWCSIPVLKAIIQERVKLQEEDGLVQIRISPVETTLCNPPTTLKGYQDMFDVMFSDILPDPGLM
jgi:hypothetical protein